MVGSTRGGAAGAPALTLVVPIPTHAGVGTFALAPAYSVIASVSLEGVLAVCVVPWCGCVGESECDGGWYVWSLLGAVDVL